MFSLVGDKGEVQSILWVMNSNLKAIRYVIDGENIAQWYKR